MLSYFFAVLVVAVAVNADPIRHRGPHFRGLSGRIVGGENTTIQTYPYQVSIQWSGSSPSEHLCGGAIISAHYVVTAAHCTLVMPSGKHTIRAGSTLKNEGGSVHEIDWYENHHKYNYTETGVPLYDVAVIRVKQPFRFDETRQPIELMDQDVKPGAVATVTGWGDTHSTPNEPDQLQVVTLPVVDKKVCDQAYSKTFGGLPEAQICAGYLGQGGKDACQRDSGGPMAVDGKLAGIVSWGDGCGDPKYPGVYTEVARVRDWIAEYAEL